MYQVLSAGLREGAIIQKPILYFTPRIVDFNPGRERWFRVGYIP